MAQHTLQKKGHKSIRLRQEQVDRIFRLRAPYVRFVKLLSHGYSIEDAGAIIGRRKRGAEQYTQKLYEITGCTSIAHLVATFIRNDLIK